MIIKSSYKDYYDFVAYLNGGGDPMVPYIRDRLWEKRPSDTYKVNGKEYKRERYDSPEDFIMPVALQMPNLRYSSNGSGFSDFYWKDKAPGLRHLIEPFYEYGSLITVDRTLLIVAGQLYVIEKVDYNRGIPPSQHPKEVLPYRKVLTGDAHKFWHSRFVANNPSDYLSILCSTVNHPVFEISDWHARGEKPIVSVEPLVPRLGDLGFVKVMSPEQCYQTIAQYLGHMLWDPANPRNKQTQPEKIVSHGFDLKQSFRHRK